MMGEIQWHSHRDTLKAHAFQGTARQSLCRRMEIEYQLQVHAKEDDRCKTCVQVVCRREVAL